MKYLLPISILILVGVIIIGFLFFFRNEGQVKNNSDTVGLHSESWLPVSSLRQNDRAFAIYKPLSDGGAIYNPTPQVTHSINEQYKDLLVSASDPFMVKGLHGVYYYGGPVEGADPNTFNRLFSSESGAVYYGDKNYVYSLVAEHNASGETTGGAVLKALPYIDSATFVEASGTSPIYDASDANHRYYFGEIVK